MIKRHNVMNIVLLCVLETLGLGFGYSDVTKKNFVPNVIIIVKTARKGKHNLGTC